MDLGLRGRTAIVCGASSGLGLGVARSLAGEGANVLMSARRADVLAERAAELGALAHPADLSEPDAATGLVEAAVGEFGGVDVLVWNSGGPPPKPASAVTDDDLLAGTRSLLVPAVRLIRAALPHLRRSDAGRILAITAAGVKEPMTELAISNALRPGLTGYLKSLAREVAPAGITVNCLAPGFVDTDRLRQVFPDGPPPEVLASVPVGRVARPDEIGDVAAFLASPRASYVTGSTIAVDGGLTRFLFG